MRFAVAFTLVFVAKAGGTGFHVEEGANACGPECGGTPMDHPGRRYIGVMDNMTACLATCAAVSRKECPIVLWSGGSKHCWWRTDGVWDVSAVSYIVSACRDGSDGHVDDCVPGCGACPVQPPPVPSPPPFVPTDKENMNGEYLLSQTPGAHQTQERFPTNYKDYPGGVMSFDVYSPKFSTLYSQVWWSGLDPVALPEDVVARYANGGAMAVVGFELDQVLSTPEGDVSIPINVAYNHHFESTMTGGGAEMKKITLSGPADPQIERYGLGRMGHGGAFHAGQTHWVVEDDFEDGGIPTSQAFGGANGGEVRKSFHGYAPGFAQVIKSPKQFQITPMQIDTWHREKMNVTGSPFVAGPLPRSSLAAADAPYSGLLECPVTTRIRKDVDSDYAAKVAGTCGTEVLATAAECYEAASKVLAFVAHGVPVSNKTVSDTARPHACSVETNQAGDRVTVFFNEAESEAKCGTRVTARAGVTQSLVTLNVSLDLKTSQATIAITGPADVWFAVGFNASAMKDAPWAIVVDGDGNVSERKLADQSPGKELDASVTLVSSSLEGGLRTVVLSRPMVGKTADHFSFSEGQDIVLPFINAVGQSKALSYHKDKSPSTLALLPVSGDPTAGACVCAKDAAPFGQGKGTLNYMPTNQDGERGHPTTIAFNNKCEPFPRTDLLEMQNPTCDVRTYTGGQIACHHMFSLLDADQDIPWADQPLEYQLKFRFWYQDYNASYHHAVKRTTWGIGSMVEYDVPKCAEGIQGCAKDADGNWIHTITGTYKGNGNLVAAHFHCHAPTCLSVKMYRDWNGTDGQLICEERPVYGGTGKVDLPKYDELGFLLQPPCLWGSEEHGLEPPPDVHGVTMHTIKTAYANSGHHGEMAWQQMYYVDTLAREVFV